MIPFLGGASFRTMGAIRYKVLHIFQFDKLEFVNLIPYDSACDFSPIHNGYGRVNALWCENELSRRACV